MKIPPLTIALLTYNRKHYLKEALDAILCQTFTDFDLLVMDNGSTDGTAEMVLANRDPRLTYVRHPPGHGPEYNGACAQWFARGKRLLGAHDDDVLEPTMVELQMAFMDAHPDVMAVATNASLINEHGEIVQAQLKEFQGDTLFQKGEYLPFYLKNKYPLPLSSLMVDTRTIGRNTTRKYFETINSDDIFLAGDVFYGCMLNCLGPLGLLGKPLLRYRIHQAQSSVNMNLVKPELDLMLALERQIPRSQMVRAQKAAIKAAILRYRGQEILLGARRAQDLPEVAQQLKALQLPWSRAVPGPSRLQDAVLPFEILALLLGLKTTLPTGSGQEDCWPVLDDPARLAFRAWYRKALAGEGLFAGPKAPKRIAVLGSSLVAYLIVLEARRSGVEVVCCLDSNVGRQGDEGLIGLPVYPHQWLADHADTVDALVLSTEGRHEGWLRSAMKTHLGDRTLPMPSWKEFLLGSNLL